MLRTLIGALMAASFAGAASAQQAGALFVSPMGEPHRSERAGQDPIAIWIAAADADADGKLSYAEYQADALAFFARLDANGDAIATSVESTAIYDREAPEMFSDWDVIGPTRSEIIRARRDSIDRPVDDQRLREAPVIAQRGAQRFGIVNVIEPVMSCDRNFDRRVARAEFEACAAQRFTQIDANRDGFFEPATDLAE